MTAVARANVTGVRKNKWLRYAGFVGAIALLELLWMSLDRQSFRYFWTLPTLTAAIVMATGTLEIVEPSSDAGLLIKAVGFVVTASLVLGAALGVWLVLLSFNNPMSTLVHAFR